jgi:hypothetical protein
MSELPVDAGLDVRDWAAEARHIFDSRCFRPGGDLANFPDERRTAVGFRNSWDLR